MAAVVVTAQNTRLDDAETNTDWASDGGGAGGGLETDFKYQASNCFARKGGTGSRAIFLSDDASGGNDLSGTGTYETVMVKFICTTPGLLELLSVPGMRLEIGSGSTTIAISTNFHFYNVQGSDTYPIDKSWLVLPIDPNIASHRSGTTGTPDLTSIDCFALRYDQTAVSKSPNQAMDAVDIGAGLTLVGGDGGDADGVWQDFSDHDFGTAANRYGYVREVDGAPAVFLIFGRMIIGTSAATVFNDSDATIIFPDGLFAAGFSGITIDLQSATTNIDFVDTNFFGKGTKSGEDTRPTFIVTSTSGDFDTSNCVFDVFASITLTSACSIVGGKISGSELVTQVGSTITSVDFSAGTGTHYILSDNPALITLSDFVQGVSGHAVRCDVTGTYSWSNTDSGYTGTRGTNLVSSSGSTDAMFFNNSGGLITLNVTGVGQSPSVRNGASATTVVNNTVTVTVTGVTEGAAIKIIADATVGGVTAGDILLQTLADSNGEASFAHNYEGDLSTIFRVRQQGLPNAAITEDGGVFTDETTNANSSLTDDMTLFPSATAVNDAYYFAHNEQFNAIKLDISQAGVGTWTLTWEYYNGTIFTALSGIVDGTNGFQNSGENKVTWTIPGDWADTTINSQGPFRFVRARVSSFTSSTTFPLGRKVQLNITKFLQFDTTQTIVSTGLTVVANWNLDTISTF